MRFSAIVWIAALSALNSHGQEADTAPVRELTLAECVQLALENNLDIQIQRLGPQISNFNLESSRGAYDPQFFTSANWNESTRPGGFNSDGLPIPGSESENWNYRAGFDGLLPSGLTYTIDTAVGDITESNVAGVTEAYSGNIGVSVSQPLLRNFWIDGTRLNIQLNRNRLQVSEQTFTFQVMQTIAAVERAYFNLVASIEGVKVQEKALELGERTLAENRQRVKIGTMAPLDVQEAEAQVATTRADALNARRLLDVSENTLKNLITADYAAWQSTTLTPDAELIAKPADLDVYESWRKGLTQRPDLIQTRINLESQDIQLKYDHNQLFPSLDVFGSYGLAGYHSNSVLGDRDLGEVGDQISDRDAPSYAFGVQLRIPLSRKAERNRYRASEEAKEQLILQLKQQEQQIMVNIDNAVKLARTNYERVQATTAARRFAEAALDAEQKKLESGKSTTFVVIQRQRDLTDRSAAEISALADYYLSLTDLSLLEGSILDRNDITVEIEYH